ncbi:MAG TPA: heme o synthase [Candidatus Binataceae bacterium]|nr:heme o synthase [Candidatus Binataceae bacterium]
MTSNTLAVENRLTFARGRIVAYYELAKPRVLAMVLIAALAGFYMASGAGFDSLVALKMLAGVTLAAGGTLALNQYVERDTDAIMRRTRERPVPSGRITPVEALLFGAITTAIGIAYLWGAVNPLAASVTSAVTVLYLAAYTPMKRYSWLCHAIGAVPGALPPVIGWAAARGSLAPEPFVLFGIMVLWQLPHSLSIARLYQEDYARAGLSLLPRDRTWGNPASLLMLVAAATLMLFGMLPTWMDFAGRIYLFIALPLGGVLFAYTIALVLAKTTARRVMFATLIYLPVVLLVMVLDKL